MRQLILAFIFLWPLQAMALTQIVASVDKNPVLTNESFVLTITADDEVNRSAIDTSALLKEFVVGQTQVSSSTRSINGKTTRTTSWNTVLIARKAGTYIIPSFQVQGVKSKPIRLTVQQQQAGAQQQRDVYVTSRLLPEQIYPGQTAVLQTKLHLAVQLDRGSLSDPESAQATFAQMGEDTDKMEIVNGRRYRVITRNYAVTAEQPGKLTIRPPMFSGSVMTSARRSLFDMGSSKPVQVLGEDLTLEVMTIPKGAPTPFIPAEYLTLKEQKELPQEVNVGDPITRQIVLIGTGVGEELLPALTHAYPDHVNVYPDKVELSTSYQGSTVISQRIENVALIATKPGSLTLPEIRIPYWDTRYHQQAEVVLPARTIKVLPAAIQSEPVTATPELVEPVEPQVTEPGYFRWLAALFALLWLFTLLGWVIYARKLARQPKAASAVKAKPKAQPDSWQALTLALEQHPKVDLSKPLRRWLSETFGVTSLSALPQAEEALKAYQALQASRFAKTNQPADIEPLKQALQKLQLSKQQQQGKQAEKFRLY